MRDFEDAAMTRADVPLDLTQTDVQSTPMKHYFTTSLPCLQQPTYKEDLHPIELCTKMVRWRSSPFRLLWLAIALRCASLPAVTGISGLADEISQPRYAF